MRTHTKALIGAGVVAALTVGGFFAFLAHADTNEVGPAKGRFKKQLAQLGVTDDQKAQVKAILRKYQPTAGPLIQQVVTERRALRDLGSELVESRGGISAETLPDWVIDGFV